MHFYYYHFTKFAHVLLLVVQLVTVFPHLLPSALGMENNTAAARGQKAQNLSPNGGRTTTLSKALKVGIIGLTALSQAAGVAHAAGRGVGPEMGQTGLINDNNSGTAAGGQWTTAAAGLASPPAHSFGEMTPPAQMRMSGSISSSSRSAVERRKISGGGATAPTTTTTDERLATVDRRRSSGSGRSGGGSTKSYGSGNKGPFRSSDSTHYGSLQSRRNSCPVCCKCDEDDDED